ncbi:hypothetical protein [Spirosoma montaniterrae]|uniref:DUF4263 domain-containing protein n=1 Tax=Spirosoma montaniterrae TaxID=1178516 RepID=A0A1P9WX60_9BACT|nr:hypothetical protein [Spirosoma montaniterrae]AQG79933.1 hypothetical protein AWR27_11720 [Spirosoma montaniterrae]
MARILATVDSTWYEELSLVSYYYESQFEHKVISHAAFVFPDYYVMKYKKVMHTAHGKTSTPDLVMVRKSYEDWWVVEVEKADHPIEHVLGQVEVFSNAELNAIETSKYIIQQNSSLDEKKVLNLIRNERPKVLVIVDQPKDSWKRDLANYNTKLCVFQVFKNNHGLELYRINGEYPYIYTGDAHCRMVSGMVNTLEVINPEILDSFVSGDELELVFKEQMTKWEVFFAKGKMHLKSVGMSVNKLPVGKDYIIRKDSFDRYHIEFN